MKLFQLVEEGFIAKFPQNFVQNLAILLSKTTGFCLMSSQVVENILLMVLKILPVTCFWNRQGNLVYLWRKFCPLKVKIEKRQGHLFTFIFLKNLFDFEITESHANEKK